MEGLKQLPVIAIALAVAGIILGASVITLGSFGDTIASKCYNSSYIIDSTGSFCNNATNISASGHTGASSGYDNLNLSNDYYVVLQSMESENSVSSQLPTVSIIMVMVIIISVIMGVFTYMRYFA